MPWVGCVSTAGDLTRFAEMLRSGGTLDGKRIDRRARSSSARARSGPATSPTISTPMRIRAAGGIAPPANLGLGFSVRGPQMGTTMFGTLGSPGTFGAHGAGTTMFWVDPQTATSASSG